MKRWEKNRSIESEAEKRTIKKKPTNSSKIIGTVYVVLADEEGKLLKKKYSGENLVNEVI